MGGSIFLCGDALLRCRLISGPVCRDEGKAGADMLSSEAAEHATYSLHRIGAHKAGWGRVTTRFVQWVSSAFLLQDLSFLSSLYKNYQQYIDFDLRSENEIV